MLYDHLISALEKEYSTVRVMKENERGSVILLCHNKSGQRFVFHHYKGNGDVYQKLLGLSCPGLPRILEAAQKDGMVAVLEEYVQGDQLSELLEACEGCSGRQEKTSGPFSFGADCASRFLLQGAHRTGQGRVAHRPFRHRAGG